MDNEVFTVGGFGSTRGSMGYMFFLEFLAMRVLGSSIMVVLLPG